MLKRAKVILNNRSWEELNYVEQGQINALYHDQFRKFGTEDDVINWLKQK